jgi:hypothetical protein
MQLSLAGRIAALTRFKRHRGGAKRSRHSLSAAISPALASSIALRGIPPIPSVDDGDRLLGRTWQTLAAAIETKAADALTASAALRGCAFPRRQSP